MSNNLELIKFDENEYRLNFWGSNGDDIIFHLFKDTALRECNGEIKRVDLNGELIKLADRFYTEAKIETKNMMRKVKRERKNNCHVCKVR